MGPARCKRQDQQLALVQGWPEQGKAHREKRSQAAPKPRGTHRAPRLSSAGDAAGLVPPCFAAGLGWNNPFGLFLLSLRSRAAGEDRADQTSFTAGGAFRAELAARSQAHRTARPPGSSSPRRPRAARRAPRRSACSGTRCWGAPPSTRWPHTPRSRAGAAPRRGTPSGSFTKQGEKPWAASKEGFNSQPKHPPPAPGKASRYKCKLFS